MLSVDEIAGVWYNKMIISTHAGTELWVLKLTALQMLAFYCFY